MRGTIRLFLPAAFLGASSFVAGCGADDVASPTDGGHMDSSATPDGGNRDGTAPSDTGVPDTGVLDGGGVDGNVPADGSADGGGLPPADAGEAGDGGGPLELTVFAKQLIETQTLDNNTPTTTEDKTFVDTPPPGVFPPSFFP